MSILACDIGGTRIKLGIVDQGRIQAGEIIPGKSDQGLAQALPRMKDALLNLCKLSGMQAADCQGLGIGFPALVNSREGKILNEYGRYRDAPTLDLRAWARENFALPLAIDNDARVALLGEWSCGAGYGSDNLAIITLGTGIGTAVMSEGRLLRGPHFQAGNLCGHLVVNPGGRSCFCGGHGCVEAETGTAQLAARARSMEGFAGSVLAQLELIDYEAVCKCVTQGDAFAVELLDRATTLWGVLCVNMIHAFDLDRIVIGGGLMASMDLILPPVRDYVNRYADTPWGKVQVVAAQQPDQMALLGCEPLVHELLR